MKKLYSLTLAVLMSVSVFAQVDETFVFTDAAGNIIPDGTTITVNTYEIDEFTEDFMFNSGLFVKNTSSSNAYASMDVTISKMDNGEVQHCFPGTCAMYGETGTYKRTDVKGIRPGELQDIRSEWKPVAEGTCTVTYAIRLMKQTKPVPPTYEDAAKCAAVTVNYVYDANSKEAGITEVENTKSNARRSYNLAGQKVGAEYKGVIVKNGKKYLNK